MSVENPSAYNMPIAHPDDLNSTRHGDSFVLENSKSVNRIAYVNEDLNVYFYDDVDHNAKPIPVDGNGNFQLEFGESYGVIITFSSYMTDDEWTDVKTELTKILQEPL
jgi:hypothetical protein